MMHPSPHALLTMRGYLNTSACIQTAHYIVSTSVFFSPCHVVLWPCCYAHRFVWGRSRLPLTAEGFKDQRFRLQQFPRTGRPADQYLPVAHTCFFSLELPRYSSLQVTRERLQYAIFNCQAIDGDGSQSHDSTSHWLEEDE